jgi:hypothetical protein
MRIMIRIGGCVMARAFSRAFALAGILFAFVTRSRV